MSKPKDGCVQPAKGPIIPEAQSDGTQAPAPTQIGSVVAKVGKPFIDFEAPAYINGGFENIKLSDYQGKWIVLCFYPGDFTFV